MSQISPLPVDTVEKTQVLSLILKWELMTITGQKCDSGLEIHYPLYFIALIGSFISLSIVIHAQSSA